jgi:LPXTG-motif cell wall-anchored protein
VLSWAGPLPVGDSVTITYTVTVNTSKTGDGQLLNVVTTPDVLSANCGPDSSDPQCRTATPVTFPTPPANNGGGLPNTGVAALTMGLIALLLLAGGGLLMVAARRRSRRTE